MCEYVRCAVHELLQGIHTHANSKTERFYFPALGHSPVSENKLFAFCFRCFMTKAFVDRGLFVVWFSGSWLVDCLIGSWVGLLIGCLRTWVVGW